MKDVPNGTYEAILRVKISRLNFVGDWRIWVADSSGVHKHNYEHNFAAVSFVNKMNSN